jgi:hypothetical protein
MKKLIVLAASRLLPGRSPMKITRRFAVTALLVSAVAVAALLAGASALAGHGGYGQTSTYRFKLPPTGIEPDASGVVKMALSLYNPVSGARGTVTCTGLTPNANYVVLINAVYYNGVQGFPWTYRFSFTTDARGAGGIAYSVQCSSFGPTFGVTGGPSGQLVLASPGFTYP